jgi:hypothetical protein
MEICECIQVNYLIVIYILLLVTEIIRIVRITHENNYGNCMKIYLGRGGMAHLSPTKLHHYERLTERQKEISDGL